MSTARKIVDCAKALDTMKECIINNNFRYEEVEDLDFFVNGIKDSIDIIHNWINGINVMVEETIEPEEETFEPIEPVISGFNLIESIVNEAAEEVVSNSSVIENVTDKPKTRHKRSQKDLGYDEIGKYIAHYCNQCNEIDTVNRCLEVFPEIGKRNINRFISKISNTKISDKYFKVVDGIIVAIKPTESVYVEETDVLSAADIMNKMFDKEKFIRTCSNLNTALRDEILLELYKNDFNLKTIDLSNYDASRLTAMETVKRAAVSVMNVDCVLDGIDCCIMISSAVTSCGKKRVQKIVNFLTKIWNWGSVSDSDIYDVINKKIYPEISDKFFK